MAIELTDKFDDAQGRFLNYDTYSETDRNLIIAQSHVDIRSLFAADSYSVTVEELNLRSMTNLNTLTMSQLDGLSNAGITESWTSGSISEDSSYGYYNVLAKSCGAAGSYDTSSTITNPDGSIRTVDILTGFEDTDFISIGFPEYPKNKLTEASCFVDFTSHPTANFSAGPTASVAMTASTVTMANGADSEFRVARSAFDQNGIDLSSITGVRFRWVTTVNPTVIKILGGVRLLSANWARFNNDINTITERLVRTPPVNGDHTSSPAHTLPVLWRSDTPSGSQDPKPIDVEAGILFYTGHIANTNTIDVYFRERTLDYMTQTDLDGMSMGDLDGLPQPDLGTALYTARKQSELDILSQSDLDGDQQYDLERIGDSVSSSWIKLTLQWDASFFTFEASNSEGVVFAPTPYYASQSNQRYLFIPKLEENTVSFDLYLVGENGELGSSVLHVGGDSGLSYDLDEIVSDWHYKRRTGRFGWQSDIVDANAWIDGVVVRKATFAEYRSRPLHSNTPVDGARLFTTTSGPQEFFESIGPGPYNVDETVVSYNPPKYTAGNGVQVNGASGTTLQGVQTNLFYVENFEDLNIKFDLYCSDVTSSPDVFLLNQSRSNFIELLIKPLKANQWNSIEAYLAEDKKFLHGFYSLVIIYPGEYTVPWTVDNVRIQTPSVIWDGRGDVGTAWNTNIMPWTPFKDAVNHEANGIVFPYRGKTLQVRAKGLRQESSISRIEVKPKYTELGRILEY
jgi:hypothetical protein